jgi:hypothetical protein
MIFYKTFIHNDIPDGHNLSSWHSQPVLPICSDFQKNVPIGGGFFQKSPMPTSFWRKIIMTE